MKTGVPEEVVIKRVQCTDGKDGDENFPEARMLELDLEQ